MAITIGNLDSQWITQINNLMAIEQQPLTKLQQARDDITVSKGIYTDLKGMIDSLQTSTRALISTNSSYSLTSGRAVKISGVADGASVVTASASSSASAARYTLSVTSLASQHQVFSAKKDSMTAALGLTGTFLLGGKGTLTNTTALSGTVDGFLASANVFAGQSELSSGVYSVETQESAPGSGVFQFRLVDSNGAAQSISNGSGSFTSDWQNIPNGGGAFDTGRGLTLTLGTGPTYTPSTYNTNSAHLTYTAGRASISVGTGDSLSAIAYNINNALYPAGNEAVATVVDGTLILSSKGTGTGHTLSASDSSADNVLKTLGILKADGSGSFTSETAPTNAVFTINNLPAITRSSNTGLTDVISGVTLNLATDAQGKSAVIDVSADSTSERNTIKSFIDNFNKLNSYLSTKTSTIKGADGTYTRGALAGDDMLRNMRMDLLRAVNSDVTNSGTYKNLRQIGLGVDDNMQLQIVDSTKLDEALRTNKANVTSVLDAAMSGVDTRVSRFTGKGGYVTSIQKSLDDKMKATADKISSENVRLTAKQQMLVDQYAQVQATLSDMQYQQARLAALFGGSTTA